MVGVVEAHRIAFFGIHKAATSTVKLALWELREGRPWKGDPMKVHKHFPNDRIRSSDLHRYSCYWRFTIIRDPIRRFLSAYQNRVVDYADLIHLPGRKTKPRQEDLALPDCPDIETFIAHYDAYCRRSHSIWIHTCTASVFIGKELSYFDAVYTTDEMTRLERDLSSQTNTEIKFTRVNESMSAPPAFDDLSRPAQDFLLEHTKQDYALFEASFTPPTRKLSS